MIFTFTSLQHRLLSLSRLLAHLSGSAGVSYEMKIYPNDVDGRDKPGHDSN
jgi:hypothetical protein